MLKGKHILIIEDDRHLADVLTRLVRQYGIRVTHAESGNKTLDALKQELPDLMLLDLGLPDMSGLDLITQVRWEEKTKSIPILAMSGNPTEERKCLRIGCNDFILKPFDAPQLLERIARLLSRTD
jgi:DNA-binding response OmpR family regulator